MYVRTYCIVPFRPTTASSVPEKFVHIEAHGCSRLMTNFFEGTTEVSAIIIVHAMKGMIH